jgi:hypothetical protein
VAGATRLRWQAVRAIDAELAKDLVAVVLEERDSLATAGIAAAWPPGRPAANCGYRADPVKMRVATSKPVPAGDWKRTRAIAERSVRRPSSCPRNSGLSQTTVRCASQAKSRCWPHDQDRGIPLAGFARARRASDRELVVRALSTQAPFRHALGGQEVRGDAQKHATAAGATCATQKKHTVVPARGVVCFCR